MEKELIDKLDLTNELLFRLCVGQRLLSNKECIAIRDLIPRLVDQPCYFCQAKCVEYDERISPS